MLYYTFSWRSVIHRSTHFHKVLSAMNAALAALSPEKLGLLYREDHCEIRVNFFATVKSN
uniref:Uncharacterized protein n=1 Tax=Coccidioides posadasii RMSCC 3488 TaxID=454284 RepID=A0A0J6EY45_COCPO|nr:hypothetical protein CPAG_01847 [Coccidioides posadasii RMSCC 3488]KMM65497.1 hypothetical protein, variant [Coccidioides posadasii RMSCC 3488]